MGTGSARGGVVRQHAVGPHLAAGLTDRTGIVAASVAAGPAPETEAPAGWRGWRASSTVMWAGAVMAVVLALSSGLDERPAPDVVASVRHPQPDAAATVLPPAPTPVPSVGRSAHSIEPNEPARGRADESASPTGAPAQAPPAVVADDADAVAQQPDGSAAPGELLQPPTGELAGLEDQVEDQVADRVETFVEPMRRVVDDAFGMLLDITDQ